MDDSNSEPKPDQAATPPGGAIHLDTGGGRVASHPQRLVQALLVAPTTTSENNTLGLDLVAVACLSLHDVLFEFDSSFPLPTAADMLKELPGLREKHKSSKGELPPLSIFGHADPVGGDVYNKPLSGRRARAIYGVLTHDLNVWQQLFNEEWKSKNGLQFLRDSAGQPDGTPLNALMQAYMTKLFPGKLAKSEFLGKGADPKGKADIQGCSDFNPLIILSQDESAHLPHRKRNELNQPDRRVVVFLFRPGMIIRPALWPCPTADDPAIAACKKRFFGSPKTGEQRIKAGAERRDFTRTADTFACRFYDRVARLSPCERIIRSFRIRLFDNLGLPVKNAPYLASEGTPAQGTAGPGGDLALANVEVPSTCTVHWSRPENFKGSVAPGGSPKPEDFEFSLDVFIDVDAPESQDAAPQDGSPTPDPKQIAAQRRLSNLGFDMGDSPEDNIRFFQREFGALETGKLEDVEDVLTKRHDLSDPPTRYKTSSGPSLPPAPPQAPGDFPPDPVPQPEDV